MKQKSMILILLVAGVASAANISLTASDGYGASSFNSAGHWSNGAAPSAGNDYFVSTAGLLMRTPADGSNWTFAGDSLTIATGAGTTDKGLGYKGSGSTLTVNNLILNGGGVVHINAATQVFNLAGNINVAGNSSIYARQGPINVYAAISGSATITNPGSDTTACVLRFYSSANTFTGNFVNNGRFELADNGRMNFVIGASGVNNSASGTGTATFHGDFAFDLSAAGGDGSSWTIANVATQSFSSTFTVVGFTDAGGNKWTKTVGVVLYTFEEATGTLTAALALEPPHDPNPSDGATEAPLSTTQLWWKGSETPGGGVDPSVVKYHVWTNEDDPNSSALTYQGEAPAGTTALASYTLGAALEKNKIYYWQVEEVIAGLGSGNPGDPENLAGPVWHFKTLRDKKLLAWYKFEGDLNDSAGSNHATAVNGMSYTAGVAGISGQSYAADPDGGNYGLLTVNAYPKAGYGNGLEETTISCWMKAAPDGFGTLIGNYNGPGYITGVRLNLQSDGRLHLHLRDEDGSQAEIVTTEQYDDGEWHFVTATATSTGAVLYVDAADKSVAAATSTLDNFAAWQNAMVMLADNNRSVIEDLFPGEVDDLKIYNYAMTAEEVAQAYYDVTGESSCIYPSAYDVNGDCKVNLLDYAKFEEVWLDSALQNPTIMFNNNGAWCWYQDERVIVHDGNLIMGSVADASGTDGATRNGDVEVVTYDIATQGPAVRFTLHDNLEADDHDAPAFLPRPDGRILAMYSRHLTDHLIRYRITTNPNDTSAWQSEVTLTRNDSVTYSNVYRLSAENGGNGRIYDFYRGEYFNPNYVYSDDNGQTWSYGGRLISKENQRPYVKYIGNNVDKIHFITTEGHPRNYYNSIYHGYIYNGGVYKSDGTFIRALSAGPVTPDELTKVYQGGANNNAWTTAIRLDSSGNPYIAFSVHMGPDVGGVSDLRYHYGRWDGSQWHTYEIAYAGTELYDGEDDYTGLVGLDPHDPDVLYISTNADPDTGAALISSADGKRHWELYQGNTSDSGANWTWRAITENSTADNLRPIMPVWPGGQSVLLWMTGTYTSYTNFDTDIVGMFDPKPLRTFKNADAALVDFNGDWVINIEDLAAFLSGWLDCGLYPECP